MKLKIIIVITALTIIVTILGITYLYYKKPDFSIPQYIYKEFSLRKEKFNQKDVYILGPKERKNEKIILYQHGGSYATNLTNVYWDFFADIIRDTGVTIIIPDYPLTPSFYYKDVFDMMVPLYEETIKKVGADNLIVMGDSAGGGLSLALCQDAGKKGLDQPSRLILISPWLDVSMKNSKIDEAQKNDKLLNKDLLKLAGQVYARDGDINYDFISPINGPLDKIKNVTIFSGSYDILNPDTELFVEKAKNAGLEIDYRKTEKAVHIWILYHRDQKIYHAQEDYEQLIRLINKGV